MHLQVTENVIEHNDLQPEPITEEQGNNVPNSGLNQQKIGEQNVENSKDTKNGDEDNAEKKSQKSFKKMKMNNMKLKIMFYVQYI